MDGTFVNWSFNSRDHGFFRSQGFTTAPDSLKRVLLHFEGDGETNDAGRTTQAPGKYLNDAGTNWDGKVVRANGDTVRYMVLTLYNIGYFPSTYKSDIEYFFTNATNLPDTSVHKYYAMGSFSGGPGRMWGTLLESGFAYANVIGTTLSVSPTFLGVDVTAISEGKRNVVFRNGDDANGGTPEGAANDLFTDLSGFKSLKKPAATGQGHSADSAYSIYGVANNTLTDSSKSFWRLVAEWSAPVPDTTTLEKIPITARDVYNLTGYKNPENLFDGDTATVAIKDFFNGYILDGGLNVWVDLKGYLSKFRIRANNKNGSFNVPIYFRFYKSYADTATKTAQFTYLTANGWTTLDTITTKAIADSFSLMQILFSPGANATQFGEVEVYGKRRSGTALPIVATGTIARPDKGRRAYGYGKVFLPYSYDTVLAALGMSIREQNDMDYVDTCTTCPDNAHTYVLDKFQPEKTLQYDPLRNNGSELMIYHASASTKNKNPAYGANSKDIPIGSDSTTEAAWINQYRFANWLADSLGNTMIYECGNEDEADWGGATRWHSPLVRLRKLAAYWKGVKAACANCEVALGPTPFRDSSHRKGMLLLSRMLYGYPNFMDSLYSINYNHYHTTAGGQGGSNTDGVTPEQDDTYSKWIRMKRFHDYFFPNSYLIWTEIGYDSLSGSNYNIPTIAGKANTGIAQAEWMLRSYELGAAAGLDAVYQYTQTTIGGGDFASTGFVKPREDPPGSFIYYNDPTRQYFYITAMMTAKQNYQAAGTVIQSGDSTGVWIVEYPHVSDASKKLRAVWYGTRNNTSNASYSLSLPGASSATYRRPTNNVVGGTTGSLTLSGGAATLLVDEAPVYVEVTYTTNPPAILRSKKFTKIIIQ